MHIVLFVIILGVLIFVHELGHFLSAKRSGMLVHTFAIGFPPTIFQKKIGETTYQLNLIPFGGFVRIEGQDPELATNTENTQNTPNETSQPHARAMYLMSWGAQARTLIAGVVANVLLALALMIPVFMAGTFQQLTPEETLIHPHNQLLVTEVLPDSQSQQHNILPGSVITQVNGQQASSSVLIEEVRKGLPVQITTESQEELIITPQELEGVFTIGAVVADVALVQNGFFSAIGKSTSWTIDTTGAIFQALGKIIGNIFSPTPSDQTLTGPIGIVDEVHKAQSQGIIALFLLTAIISLNLAVLNILPLPALDGGRLLIITLEKLRRKPFSPRFVQTFHGIGFMLFMLLLVWVTIMDIGLW